MIIVHNIIWNYFNVFHYYIKEGKDWYSETCSRDNISSCKSNNAQLFKENINMRVCDINITIHNK